MPDEIISKVPDLTFGELFYLPLEEIIAIWQIFLKELENKPNLTIEEQSHLDMARYWTAKRDQ